HGVDDGEGALRAGLAAQGDEVGGAGEGVERVGGEGEVVVERFGEFVAEEVAAAHAVVVEQPVGVGDEQEGAAAFFEGGGDGGGRLGVGGGFGVVVGFLGFGRAVGEGAGEGAGDECGEGFLSAADELGGERVGFGELQGVVGHGAGLVAGAGERGDGAAIAGFYREAAGFDEEQRAELGGGGGVGGEVVGVEREPDGHAGDAAAGVDGRGVQRVADDVLRVVVDAPALEQGGKVAGLVGGQSAEHGLLAALVFE